MLYIACDKDGSFHLFTNKPIREEDKWVISHPDDICIPYEVTKPNKKFTFDCDPIEVSVCTKNFKDTHIAVEKSVYKKMQEKAAKYDSFQRKSKCEDCPWNDGIAHEACYNCEI